MRKIKQDPEKLGINNIWEIEKYDNKNVGIQMSKRCGGTERQLWKLQ